MKKQMRLTRRFYSIFILFCLLSTSLFGQEAAMNSINERDLRGHLGVIASDSLMGRNISDQGLEKAAQYISSNLKRLKMKQVAGAENYMQNVPLTSVKPDHKNSFLKIKTEKAEYIVKSDSLLALYPHAANFSYDGTVVFAGYGVVDTVKGYDDFDKIEVKDKIVMVMSRSLEKLDNAKHKPHFDYDTEFGKVNTIMKKGAKAILWVVDPANKFTYHDALMELYSKAYQQIDEPGESKPVLGMDFVIITPYTANMILKSSGKSLSVLQEKINSTLQPASFEIPKMKVDFQLIRRVEDFKSPNIIGYIEGSDSVLKNEYIIYTAHYDHLGVDPEGKIFHGADDNGSGTVGLLEIAEAFASQVERPKRSVVFAWMTAEEAMGLGSNYYVEHPLFPLEKTKACLNLDMIGRVKKANPVSRYVDLKDKDSLFVINGHASTELLSINTEACSKVNLVPDYQKHWKLEYSDQAFFYAKGVPVLFYHTGFSEDTHSVNDDVEKLDFQKMMRVAQAAFLVGFQLANPK